MTRPYEEDDYIEGINGEPKQVRDVRGTGRKPAPAKIVEASRSAQVSVRRGLPNQERLNKLFFQGKEAKLWQSRQEMIDRMSLVLDIQIMDSNIGDLDDSLLDLVEQAIQNPATF